jgi:hypothetical protein
VRRPLESRQKTVCSWSSSQEAVRIARIKKSQEDVDDSPDDDRVEHGLDDRV